MTAGNWPRCEVCRDELLVLSDRRELVCGCGHLQRRRLYVRRAWWSDQLAIVALIPDRPGWGEDPYVVFVRDPDPRDLERHVLVQRPLAPPAAAAPA